MAVLLGYVVIIEAGTLHREKREEREDREEHIMEYTATLTFPKRALAQEFATRWAFYSKTGYTLGAGSENVQVKLYGIKEADKAWINDQVNNVVEA
jgi:hypothetical protein